MTFPQFRWIAAAVAAITMTTVASAQSLGCEGHPKPIENILAAHRDGPPTPPPEPEPNSFELRTLQYAALAVKHRLTGLASYYSASLDGSLTATGEVFRNKHLTAAHLTLPLGSWVEVTSLATGKKIRCRVNDRGPYVRKFVVDLSRAAARALGVDQAKDRTVEIRIVALPGEEPLPEGWERAGLPAAAAEAAAVAAAVIAQ